MAEPGLEHEPFGFQRLKDDRVFLYHHDRHVVPLAGAARRFLDRADGLEGEALQLLMAKATKKNFKRGNER